METKPIFLLGGKAGSGKDTVAKALQGKLPGLLRVALADPIKKIVVNTHQDFIIPELQGKCLCRNESTGGFEVRKRPLRKRHCAYRIGDFLRSYTDALPSNPHYRESTSVEIINHIKKYPSVRSLLQVTGERFKKMFGESYWSDLLIKRIKQKLRRHPKCDGFVVTDWRFPIEYTALLRAIEEPPLSVFIHEVYPLLLDRSTVPQGNVPEHASEDTDLLIQKTECDVIPNNASPEQAAEEILTCTATFANKPRPIHFLELKSGLAIASPHYNEDPVPVISLEDHSTRYFLDRDFYDDLPKPDFAKKLGIPPSTPPDNSTWVSQEWTSRGWTSPDTALG